LKRTKEVLTRNTWEELTPGSLKFFSDTRQHKLNLYGTEVRIRQFFLDILRLPCKNQKQWCRNPDVNSLVMAFQWKAA
jgi:hypothetical protein